MEQRQAVEAFGFVHVRGAHDRGDAARDHLVHDHPQVAARDRIDAERRLVEQQQPRLVDQRAREPELLLHPPRQLPGEPVAERLEIREPVETLEPPRALVRRDFVEVRVEVEVLGDSEIGVETEALRHVRDVGLDPLGILHHRVAEHDGVAAARTQDRGQHPQRGGLAGAVGTDQAEQFARTHGEREIAHRGHRAEAAGQAVRLDRRVATGARRRTGVVSHCYRPPRAPRRPACRA